MTFVFEDNQKQILSAFYEQAFPAEITCNFMYANGSSAIVSKIQENLEVEDNIVVFLDVNPYNSKLLRNYQGLYKLSKQYHRLLVMPMISREHAFLRSLLVKGVVRSEDIKSAVYDYACPGGLNLEQYCKELCRNALPECMRTDVSVSKCAELRPYFYEDCGVQSSICTPTCAVTFSVTDKAMAFAGQFPVLPSLGGLTYADLFDLHCSLVNWYNDLSRLLHALFPQRCHGGLLRPFTRYDSKSSCTEQPSRSSQVATMVLD